MNPSIVWRCRMFALAMLLVSPSVALAAECTERAADGSTFKPTSRRDIDLIYVRPGHAPTGCILSKGADGPRMACEDGTNSPYIQTPHAPPRGLEISFDGKVFVTPCQVGLQSQEDIDRQRSAPLPEPLQSCRQYEVWRDVVAHAGPRSKAAGDMCLQLNRSLNAQGSPPCQCN